MATITEITETSKSSTRDCLIKSCSDGERKFFDRGSVCVLL